MLTALLLIVVFCFLVFIWKLYDRSTLFKLHEEFSRDINMEVSIDEPTPEQQKEILACKLAKSILAGETWYLISAKWLKNLKEYIGICAVSTQVGHPGPIDNAPILKEGGNELRRGLGEAIEYELISEDVWNYLVAWYGTCPDQQPLARKAFMSENNYTVVEVYLQEIKCQKNFDDKNESIVTISKVEKLSSLAERLRTIYEIPEGAPIKIWKVIGDEWEHLTDLDLTLYAAKITQNVLIVVETQSGGTWQKRGVKSTSPIDLQVPSPTPSTSRAPLRYGSSHVPTLNLKPIKQTTSSIQCNYSIKQPGICGLNNLGNTCFMNSVLQCLSNTPPLTDYFMAETHLSELNVDNPLGMNGEIAKAYGELIQLMWSGRFSSTNPVHFKVQVGKFNAQFYGCQQHDAQELLTFLLDGLHEDLNRVLKKPYIEAKEYAGEEDEVFAAETWSNYKKRNDSIIVDTFHGLLKSRVVCPECERLSVTFDPFCSLSVPLPSKKDRYLKIRFIPYDSSKKECLYRITVPRKGLISDLCKGVGERTGTDPSLLIVAEINNSHCHKFYSHLEYIDLIEDKDVIFVYEVHELAKTGEYFTIPVCFWEFCSPDEEFAHNHLFGVPLVVVLPKDKLRFDEIASRIILGMRRHFCIPSAMECGDGPWNINCQSSNTNFVPKLYLLDSGLITENNPLKLEFDERGDCTSDLTALLELNDADRVFGRKILVIQLKVEERRDYYSELAPELSSELSFTRTDSNDRGKVLIYDCLGLFTTCEKLGFDNAWYCPTCKKHQRASKKFDLWTLPNVLVIHLKRFSYNHRYGDKINALVDFPLKGLHLGQYVINPAHQHIKYDLIGVINHFGTTSGGHYTAYCLNKEDTNWYCFDDNSVNEVSSDDVLSPAAYVLFYLRNDNSISPVEIDITMEVN